MKPEPEKYWLLCCAGVMAFALLLISFVPQYDPDYVSAGSGFRYPYPVNILNTGSSVAETDEIPDPVIIPLKRAGRLFLIDAVADGITGNFVFDTGAKGIVLNTTYFRKHRVSPGINSTGITGGVGSSGSVTVDRIEFAGLTYEKLTADLGNLGHIENRRGVKILGLMGFSMFNGHEIVIDPVKDQLMLFRVDKHGKRINTTLPAFVPEYTQRIEGSDNIVFLKGSVGGKLLNFCFDTAAETNVISSHSNKSVMSTLTITRRTELKGAGTAVSEVLFGKMNDFSIDGHFISDMETVVTSLGALNETYDRQIDGILGYSFLEHGIVCVNFQSNQVGIRFKKGEEK